MNHYTIAALHGRGIPHLEQIAAISYESGVVISERMPGHGADHFTSVDRASISDAQIADMVDTLLAAEQAGVVVDLMGAGNTFYDPKEGFGFIDYYSTDHPHVHSRIDSPGSRAFLMYRVYDAIAFTAEENGPETQQCEQLRHRIYDIFKDKGFYQEGESEYM